MDATWINVASDAVKIGLGALIGGVLALVSAQQSHRHRRTEEYSRRRRDHLEKVMADFDQLALKVMKLTVELLHFLETASKEGKSNPQDAKFKSDNFRSLRECQLSLNPLEAKLALLDLKNAAELIDDFRITVSVIAPHMPKEVAFEELRQLIIKMEEKRYGVLDGLAKCYREA